MSDKDVTAAEDRDTGSTGSGEREIVTRRTHAQTPTGRFAQELAAANDHALIRLRARAERAEATLADLRRDAARAILGLRSQVEFWRLVADGIDRTEAAVRAGLAEAVDLADFASPDGSELAGMTDLARIAGIAGNSGRPNFAEQAIVSACVDSAESCERADLAGSAIATSPTHVVGNSGNRDSAGGGG